MKQIIDIVPATPGWYARWRLTPETTRTIPVAVWALVEEDGTPNRRVVGVDAKGQWPGAYENEPGWDFVGYVVGSVAAVTPDDVLNPVEAPPE